MELEHIAFALGVDAFQSEQFHCARVPGVNEPCDIGADHRLLGNGGPDVAEQPVGLPEVCLTLLQLVCVLKRALQVHFPLVGEPVDCGHLGTTLTGQLIDDRRGHREDERGEYGAEERDGALFAAKVLEVRQEQNERGRCCRNDDVASARLRGDPHHRKHEHDSEKGKLIAGSGAERSDGDDVEEWDEHRQALETRDKGEDGGQRGGHHHHDDAGNRQRFVAHPDLRHREHQHDGPAEQHRGGELLQCSRRPVNGEVAHHPGRVLVKQRRPRPGSTRRRERAG